MSDIFKKIRSIEVEDDAIAEALGLSPADTFSRPDSPKQKPLNLSTGDDEDILELSAISEYTPKVESKPKAKSKAPLGLTPIDTAIEMKEPVEATPLAPAVAAPLLLRPIGGSVPPLPRSKPIVEPVPEFLKQDPLMSPPTSQDKVPAQDKAPAQDKTPVVDIATPKKTVPIEFHKHDEDAMDVYNRGMTTDKAESPPMVRWIKIMGALTALLWLITSVWTIFGGFGSASARASLSAMQMLGLLFVVLTPLFIIGLATYGFVQLTRITRKADTLQLTAEALMTPDDSVIARSTIMAKSIQAQVDEVNLKVSSALNRMELLDDMVKSQGSSLSKSALSIETTTRSIEDRIGSQTAGLERVADLFEGRMITLSSMLEEHTGQLATSGQMAEQRVEEARVSVDAAAEKISSASEIVRQNAIAASQTLSGSHIEIAKLGESVQDQSIRLDALYRDHLRDLQTMLGELRGQQDELSVNMEERLSKMRDMSLSAKVGAESLTEASIKGRETVEALNEAAQLTDTAVRARFAEMEEMVKYSTAHAESISDTAARQVQKSLSSTRQEIARIEADMMGLMGKIAQADDKQAKRIAANTVEKDDTPVAEKLLGLRGRFGPKPTPPTPLKDIEAELPSMEYRDITEAAPRAPKPIYPEAVLDTTLDVRLPELDDMPREVTGIRRVSDNPNEDKSRWSWKGLFPAPDTKASGFDISPVRDADIIRSLTAIGLAPAAIVDDGCIIEASNLRKVKGSAAMSYAVAKRLGDPVRHLFRAIESDPRLKTDIRAFTEQFNARLAPVENDREAIRAKLESDAGRAYLLCESALNA